ncbi:MAG: DUF3782 domain-containing protein [Lamprobacter sp.]|uniref:PD-(D/E)XK nuclease family protein n=1 Tax=Lamprobacter sp. TaxID=3100796 RepID=UPI002B25ACB0|nr:DUF3782 domain-containing protein [Lamprobacter sp.]MEA3640868.1 DUF3782 domain-containing protein [Lamprobacter sp.]
MTTLESLKETVKRELPTWLESDPAFREAILSLTANLYSRRDETNDWFHQTLEEMRRERERQDALWRKNDERLERERQEAERKWEAKQAELQALREEQNRKWEANQAELQALREEQNRKWEANQAELQASREEQNRKWEEQNRKEEEHNRKWEEQNRKWEANQAELKGLHEESLALGKRIDRSIGALGARWGLRSEKAFRDALAGILEKTFGVEVLNVSEYDDNGEVFGRPDQVEIDVLIKNGLLILCELKSSIDKAGMYIFERKARFYERRHERKANRLIVISPMIDSRAQDVARRLGIETYGEPEEVSG